MGPRAVRANEESAEDAEGKEADVVEVLGGAEVPVVDEASEGLEATRDSDVVEVIRAVEDLEVTKAVEAVAAERQVQPKVCGKRN